jgi:hypothetical protein
MSMTMVMLSVRDVLYIWSGFYVYLMGVEIHRKMFGSARAKEMWRTDYKGRCTSYVIMYRCLHFYARKDCCGLAT